MADKKKKAEKEPGRIRQLGQVFNLIASFFQLFDHCQTVFSPWLDLHTHKDMCFTGIRIAVTEFRHHALTEGAAEFLKAAGFLINGYRQNSFALLT